MEGSETPDVREARERLRRRSRELREEREALARTARGTRDDLERIARARLRERPYLTLGTAFAVGYVLGGGLPVGLAMAAAGMGVRLVAFGLLREAVEGERLTASERPSTPQPEPGPEPDAPIGSPS